MHVELEFLTGQIPTLRERTVINNPHNVQLGHGKKNSRELVVSQSIGKILFIEFILIIPQFALKMANLPLLRRRSYIPCRKIISILRMLCVKREGVDGALGRHFEVVILDFPWISLLVSCAGYDPN